MRVEASTLLEGQYVRTQEADTDDDGLVMPVGYLVGNGSGCRHSKEIQRRAYWGVVYMLGEFLCVDGGREAVPV
jgi:hypothetical protein